MFIKGRNSYSADSYNTAPSRAADTTTMVSLLGYGLMVIGVVISVFVIPRAIPESLAYDTAEGFGYTNVKVVDKQFLFIQLAGCGKLDAVQFTAQGINPAGNQQTFYVCAGLFNSGTLLLK